MYAVHLLDDHLGRTKMGSDISLLFTNQILPYS